MKIRLFLKPAFLTLLLISGLWAMHSLRPDHFTPEHLRDIILSNGIWAPVLFITLYAIRPLFFFPAMIFTLSGGLAFGPLWGTLYNLIGATLGACLSFGLARYFGRESVQHWLGRRFSSLDLQWSGNGFRTILILRFIPIIPFDIVSYSAGLTNIRFRDYLLGTSLGIIPGTLVYNFLGYSLRAWFSPVFAIAMGLVLLWMLILIIFRRRIQGHIGREEDET